MKRIIFLIIIPFLLSACATTSQITPKLSLGMTKQEVLKNCGRPYKTGATTNSQTGEIIEALTYREYIDAPGFRIAEPDIIFVNIYFKNGKVVQYGEGMDWKTFADYEGERKIKVTTDENIKVKKEQ